MLRYVVLLSLVTAVFAGSLRVDPCPGDEASVGVILEVYSPQFDGNEDIILHKGNIYDFGIRLISGENSIALEPTIYGIIGNIKAPWKGVNQDACDNLEGSNKCPILKNQEYHYYASIEILPAYPPVGLTFQWGLTSRDSSGRKTNNQACFRMKAKIK